MPSRAIKSIFFTRFHHEKGSRVLHQVPEGSITPSTSPSALSSPLFALDSITTYLIPKQEFCDRLLNFCVNRYRVIGYPVCIREGKYSRNEFIFNFAIVVEEAVSDWVAYGEVVRKLGRLLRGLEEQTGFLSREEVGVWEDDSAGSVSREGGRLFGGSGSKVYALCEMVLEDLNNYAECMIPIDESNTINLKLFPTHPPPPPIYAHHVPLLTISLQSLTSPISSDLTLTRIVPFINGVNSISHIAQLADTDLSLTRKAVQHLVYYGCVTLLDIFSFGAVYAPTAEIGGYITDQAVQEECARYVRVPRLRFSSGMKMGSDSDISRDRDSLSSEPAERSDSISTVTAADPESNSSTRHSNGTNNHNNDDNTASTDSEIDPQSLITLYTSLRQGLPLKKWVLENLDLLHGIDIRRFITFGVIKGFLYRVHKYAVATSSNYPLSAAPTTLLVAPPPSNASGYRDSDQSTVRAAALGQHHHHQHHHQQQQQQQQQQQRLAHKPSIASTHAAKDNGPGPSRQDELTRLGSIVSETLEGREALPLVKFLDGMHAFDEICTELQMSEAEVEGKIKALGEVQIVFR